VVVDSLSVSLTLRADCDNASETIVVTASQPGGQSRSVSIDCNPTNKALHLSINKQANFTSGSFPFDYSVSGSCTLTQGGSVVNTGSSGSFSLADNQTAFFDCTAGSVVTVQEDVNSSTVDVDCSDSSGVEVGSRTVRVNANGSDGSVSCTFFNSGTASTVPASIQLSAAQLTPNCGTSTTLSAYVIGANGAVVPNGTVVTFSATPGTLSSTSATTLNGVASVVYTAPTNYTNLVTIVATAGSATASGQIRVVCVTTTAPVATQPPAPTATPRPATPPPPLVVAPPSAGDGGLLNGSPFSWSLFAAILFVAATAMGISFITQKEKSE
jgi:hypothetical protein